MKKTFSPRIGFTLVELLVSTAIISLIMLVLVSMTNQTSDMWQKTTEKVEKFEEARNGFESMTRQIGQATLNTYWQYLDGANKPRAKDVTSTDYMQFVPRFYGRCSELRFIAGPMATLATGAAAGKPRPSHGIFFTAPLGDTDTSDYNQLDNLLNVFGYYVQVGTEDSRPSFITPAITPMRWRSRLYEFRQPTESLNIYNMPIPDPTATSTNEWFTTGLSVANNSRVLAENVIALIILPKLSKEDQDARPATLLSPVYSYDSTKLTNDPASPTVDPSVNPHNQLPPIVQVTMVAVDERSAKRYLELQGGSSAQPQYFGPDSSSSFFANSANFDKKDNSTGSLQKYEQLLVQTGMTYRIFSMNVSIRGSKWSRSQTN